MLTSALAHHLDALGLATYGRAGTDTFLETMPAAPEDALALFSQPGRKAARFREAGVQVIVRADGTGGRAREGFERAEAILEALDGTARVVWGKGTDDAVRIAWCEAQQAQPTNLGDDANGLPRWSVRFTVHLSGEVV